jgi:hypothetical protein
MDKSERKGSRTVISEGRQKSVREDMSEERVKEKID